MGLALSLNDLSVRHFSPVHPPPTPLPRPVGLALSMNDLSVCLCVRHVSPVHVPVCSPDATGGSCPLSQAREEQKKERWTQRLRHAAERNSFNGFIGDGNASIWGSFLGFLLLLFEFSVALSPRRPYGL